jgi:hypothetical protein
LSLRSDWFLFGFLLPSRRRKHFRRIFTIGLELLEDLEVFELFVRLPCIFRVWVTFPVDEVDKSVGGLLITTIENSFWDVLSFALNDDRGHFLLRLIRMTFFERFQTGDVEGAIDFQCGRLYMGWGVGGSPQMLNTQRSQNSLTENTSTARDISHSYSLNGIPPGEPAVN